MKITTRMCSVVFGLLLSVSRAEAAKTWVEVDSPHFTVISADSESTTRNIAWQFEQVRMVVQALWPWSRVATDRPVVIYVAPDENTMKMLPNIGKAMAFVQRAYSSMDLIDIMWRCAATRDSIAAVI